jgi:malate/lactate dehydrogenase-like protein
MGWRSRGRARSSATSARPTTRVQKPRSIASRSASTSADAVGRLRALGFDDEDARVLADHFLDAERRGSLGHGLSRLEWLETGAVELNAGAKPRRVVAQPGYERWDANGALGYLVLAAAAEAQLADPPEHARLIVLANAFPTGALGYWVRKLADGGLAAALTANSPARLAHPDGGPKLTGTNPLAIAIPSSDGRHVVADASMSRVPHGDVIRGAASPDDVVPFGGDRAYKAFALAVGLELLVRALAGTERGAVLLVARPEADPVPAFRALAEGVRLPGDR